MLPRREKPEPPERERLSFSNWNPSEFSLLGGRGRFAPPSSDMHIGLWRKAPISSTKPRTLHRGFGFIVIRECSNARNAKSPRVFEVMDGKALPNILDRCSMSFFQPPPLNTLEPYQLEFLESIFKQVWSQIVPRHYPLSPDLRQHLQTEISARLCSFVARGVMEPTVLLGLTVATVKSPRRKVRRRGRLGAPHPVGG